MARASQTSADMKAGGTSAAAAAAATTAGKSSNSNKKNDTQKALARKTKKKDYSYRSTWKHKMSRARNLAKRGGMTKQEMKAMHGRFPKKNEWWGPEDNEKEWLAKWMLENPRY